METILGPDVIEETVGLGLLVREASRQCDRISLTLAPDGWLCLLIRTTPRQTNAHQAPTLSLALEGALRGWGSQGRAQARAAELERERLHHG